MIDRAFRACVWDGSATDAERDKPWRLPCAGDDRRTIGHRHSARGESIRRSYLDRTVVEEMSGLALQYKEPLDVYDDYVPHKPTLGTWSPEVQGAGGPLPGL